MGGPHLVNQLTITTPLLKGPLKVAKQLGPLLGLTQADVLDKLDTKSGFVYLARNLPAAKADAIKKLNIAGLTFDPSARRDYPRRWLASQVIGGVGIGEVEVLVRDPVGVIERLVRHQASLRGEGPPGVRRVDRKPL